MIASRHRLAYRQRKRRHSPVRRSSQGERTARPRRRLTTIVFGLMVALLWTSGGRSAANGQDALSRRASWDVLDYEAVRSEVLRWASAQGIDELAQAKIDALWPAMTAELPDGDGRVLDRIALTLPVVEPECGELIEYIQSPRSESVVREFVLWESVAHDEFLDAHLRLLMGRWLCQNELYDETLDRLHAIEPEHVLDPAALLFYRGLAAQRILDKDLCIASLERMLEQAGAIPARYERVAEIMLADLRPLEPDTLDEISRLMDDIRRRQRLHRSGTRVITQEEEVLAKLDKLIEELESQLQAQSGAEGSQSFNPSSPMEDSRPGGGRGPGNVDRRPTGDPRDWGNLPARERAAALAELAKDLPAHYREVIEEYFRQLARDRRD